MNQTDNITVLQRLRDAVRRKRFYKWSSGTGLVHHDSAPRHAALSDREFLAKHSILVVPHPPYSPDLAPCDFFLFPRLKSTLKGKRFQDVAEIIRHGSCRPFPKKPTRHTLKSGRITVIAAYNLGVSYFEGDNFE
jgi:hypothetical protein